MTILTAEKITDRLPHRFENLLLDQCEITAPDTSEFQLHLLPNDPNGRDLFLYDHLSRSSIPTPLLTEISALACIVSAGKIKPGTFAYFAAITNFSMPDGPFHSSAPIHGTTEKVSDKNGFFKYRFSLSNDQHQANGQLMAYYDTTGDSGNAPLDPIDVNDDVMSGIKSSTPIPAYKAKAANMTFIQTQHFMTETAALFGYQYPIDHPLIKGHFPNNPVMMGVCQWQMLEDAVAHYFTKFGHDGQTTLTCNATIFKSDFTPVCDIKSATLIGQKQGDHWHVYSSSIKKVMFKQRVLPGDQLFIHLSNIH